MDDGVAWMMVGRGWLWSVGDGGARVMMGRG